MEKRRNVFVIVLTVALIATAFMGCGGGGGGEAEIEGVELKEYDSSEVMYFCGYWRCKESADYGKFIHKDDIPVYKSPDPNAEVKYRTRHGAVAMVVGEVRLSEGPGGLWYKLEDGNWTNDLWVTPLRCQGDRLDKYSFTDCEKGQY